MDILELSVNDVAAKIMMNLYLLTCVNQMNMKKCMLKE